MDAPKRLRCLYTLQQNLKDAVDKGGPTKAIFVQAGGYLEIVDKELKTRDHIRLCGGVSHDERDEMDIP